MNSTKSPPTGNYKWFVVGLLWFVCFFNYADRQAIFSVFPLLKSEFGLTDVQLGIVGGSFMWVYAAMGPLAGLAADRISRRILIVGGLVFWSAITAATAISTQYWHLVLFRALEGLGEAFYFPASVSLISGYHTPETRSRAMAFHQSSVYAGTIAGGSVAGFLAESYGWRSGFYLFGGLGIVLAFVVILLLREPPEQAREARQTSSIREGLLEVFRVPMARLLMLVFVGANFVAMVFLTWAPSYLSRQFGLSLSMAGLSGTAFLQIASVLGVLTGGALADRAARKHLGGRARVQSIGLLCGVPILLLFNWASSATAVVLIMTAFGFCKGIYDANIWASLHDFVHPERRASAVGVMNSIGWFGGGIAPVAVAVAVGRWGFGTALSLTAAVYLIAGATLFARTAFFPPRPQPPR